MTETLTSPLIRLATAQDLSAVDALLARAYPALLKADYPPSVLVTALPIISRAQPALLSSGSYFVAEIEDEVVGAGGWTFVAPGGKPGTRGVGHVRHVVTAPEHTRRGVGRALMSDVLAHAKGSGISRMDCLSTRTAEPFYASLGFEHLGPIEVPLRAGITFPSLAMRAFL